MPSLFDQAIIKTVAYADVFNYPLTLEEIGKWLIKVKSEKLKVKSEIKKLKIVKEKDGYYCLKKRESIVAERTKREKYSQGKFKIAQRIADLLKLIPSIKLVGITGALSVNNAKENDDIDLFIITSSGLLWTTRFLSTLLVEITGMRRHPGENKVDDKICLNMFIDEKHLSIPKKGRDLFSAHEVVQMKPLFDREHTYKKFLIENQWVKKYLPNTYKEITSVRNGKDNWRRNINTFRLFESLLKKFQLWYMRNRRTTEIIRDGVIRFHPHDAREWVTRRYKQRLEKLKISVI